MPRPSYVSNAFRVGRGVRPTNGLARRNITEIEAKGSDNDRLEFIESRLLDADQLSSQGKELDAKKVWRGIVELYGNKPEFQTLVDRAEDRLHPPAEANPES